MKVTSVDRGLLSNNSALSKLLKIDFVSVTAVASHKYVISFCVGLELLSARTPLKLFAVYMCVFSLVSPLGIAIGIGISSAAGTGGDAYTLAVAILQALAGGTLIYVVVFEVLQREKSKGVSGMAQLAFVILGFASLLCIEVFSKSKILRSFLKLSKLLK